MNENKLMTPSEMLELSEQGKANFKESVLKGPVLKAIISNVEKAAVEGYTGYKKAVNSLDDLRELQVIQEYFKENGYYCEFEVSTKKSLIGDYQETELLIKWGYQK